MSNFRAQPIYVASLLFILLTVAQPVLAVPVVKAKSCAAVLASAAEDIDYSNSELSRRIHSFRESKLSKRDDEVKVKGKIYKIIAFLGRSASDVYLAKDEKGNLVTIKEIYNNDEMDWANSVYYEVAATKFYLAMGETVPKIVDYQVFKENGRISRTVLVKEYREGLLSNELEGLIKSGDKNWKAKGNLLKELAFERARLMELHQQLDAWLTKKRIDLDQHEFELLGSLIMNGDHAFQNFLYDTKIHKWILFDL